MTTDEIASLIEAKRRELHDLAVRVNFDFQHEAIQQASQSLDVLLSLWQESSRQETRESEAYNRGSADLW